MRPAALLCALALAGCAAQQAQEARRMLIGRRLLAAEECMGIPAKVETTDGVTLAEWQHGSKSLLSSLPISAVVVPGMALPLNPSGLGLSFSDSDCVAVATLRDGVIVGMAYTGADGGLSGRHAACAPIVRECGWVWTGRD